METIRELAKRLNVSKTAINSKIDRLGIRQEIQKTNGTYYLTAEQAAKVAATFSIKLSATTDNQPNTHDTKEPQTVYTYLIAQLDTKDEQIKRLQELLDQEQKLHLISKQRILELEQKQEEPQKIGFFKRLFNRTDNKKGSQTETAKDEGQETTKP